MIDANKQVSISKYISRIEEDSFKAGKQQKGMDGCYIRPYLLISQSASKLY